MRHPKHGFISETQPSSQTPAQAPKRPYVAAVNKLGEKIPDIRAAFDHFGHLRNLAVEGESFLFDEPMLVAPDKHALKFLNVVEVHNALGLRHVDLGKAEVIDLPTLGHRVRFPQHVITAEGVSYPVREGYVEVYMDADGKVFNVNSTLRYGRRKLSLEGIVSETDAIAAAKKHLGYESYASERSQLVFSSHNNTMDAVYEVVLTADNPRRVRLVLVKASNGEVVYDRSLLRYAKGFQKGSKSPQRQPDSVLDAVHQVFASTSGGFVHLDQLGGKGKRKPKNAGSPVRGKSFLRIPDPTKQLVKQIYDVIIESLPDPKVLANENFTMYVGSKSKPVKAKSDGTFNYMPNDPEFSAVVTFFCLNIQFTLMKKWGMRSNTRSIPVFVEDRSVTDNAYFDPEGYEIHIGIGSGTNSGGLARYIAYDMGVSWHENGHHIVFLQTPGNDLPGSEGGGAHEAVGDVLGDLLMDWWFRSKFATQLGAQITVADIVADPRIIGSYAMPPNGIRIQKNKARTPQDKTGEPHDDGLIIGGAFADTLVGMVQAYQVEPGLEAFGRLMLAALALVPSHRVTWRDLLNAFLTADNTLNKSANKQLITKSFGDHGITLASGRGRRGPRTPVIIVID